MPLSMPEVAERGVRLRLTDIPWTRVAQLDPRRTAVLLIRCYARVFGDLVLDHLGGGDVSDRLSAARRFRG